MQARFPLSFVVASLIAVSAWFIFHPAIMPLDAIYMYLDAVSGKHNDLHPVFMSLVMSLVLKLGGDMSAITLLQVFLGVFGVRRFVVQLTFLLGRVSHKSTDMFVSVLLVLIFSPLTPATVYFMTLWTDIWLVIALLWGISFVLQLHNEVENNRWPVMAGYIFGVSIAMLARYNAVVVYPFLSLFADRIWRAKPLPRRLRSLLIALPILFLAAFYAFQEMVLRVEHTHPERASYALDLASMIVTDPTVCTDLYIRSCTLVYSQFSKEFVAGKGAIDFTLNQGYEDVYRPFLFLYVSPRLPEEYFAAIRAHPFLLMRVKLLNLLDYILYDPTRYIIQDRVLEGEEWPTFHLSHPQLAATWFHTVRYVIDHPVLAWFSFVHVPWLALNLAGLLTIVAVRGKYETLKILFLLLLIPAAYYASYLIAFTASEFRFMYPSMLMVQLISVCVLFVCSFHLRVSDLLT